MSHVLLFSFFEKKYIQRVKQGSLALFFSLPSFSPNMRHRHTHTSFLSHVLPVVAHGPRTAWLSHLRPVPFAVPRDRFSFVWWCVACRGSGGRHTPLISLREQDVLFQLDHCTRALRLPYRMWMKMARLRLIQSTLVCSVRRVSISTHFVGIRKAKSARVAGGDVFCILYFAFPRPFLPFKNGKWL